MAITLFERHTGDAMFYILGKFIDSVLAPWKVINTAVLNDGAANMTGRIIGLTTRIQKVCDPGLVKVWFGLHQLDRVMLEVYSSSLEDYLYSTLTGMIGHLRRQQNLITDVRTTCPKVTDTCWLLISSVAEWLTEHYIRVKKHLDEKKPTCANPQKCWILMFSVHAFSAEDSAVFTSLQGITKLISKQHQRLEGLL